MTVMTSSFGTSQSPQRLPTPRDLSLRVGTECGGFGMECVGLGLAWGLVFRVGKVALEEDKGDEGCS